MTKSDRSKPVKLPYDGERFLPEYPGTIELEHLHRYRLAGSIASGLDVLDIACGEGYGSDIIAANAKSVVGVDISAPAVEHAKFHYRDPRLLFKVGSATDIPIPDASVDMVVSFETIEHLVEHDRMMLEVRRVLRPGGLLMISSPNKLEYSDKPGYANPFHVKELYTNEFVELIGKYFSNTCHYAQRLSAASIIANDQTAPFRTFSGSGVRDGVPNARYDLLLGSDKELPKLPNSAFEIPGSPLQPYAAEQALEQQVKEQATQQQAISQLLNHLRYNTSVANEILQSKWWRGTRTKRRLSNSLRKRRGRPKKIWPERLEMPSMIDGVLSKVTEVGAYQEWRRYREVEGVIPPFSRYGDGPDVPVVKYSDVQEGFVEHMSNNALDTVVKAIAFYLPQYHPFPENDEWWGKGFTEWTNVGKTQPLYPGHHQPHCPIHLGYYDLRVPEVMEEQAKLARNYGISGFAYYFYWFAGKLLMEKPLEAMRDNPNVDMPFCMIWANENWTRRWDGLNEEILISQDHSLEDSRAMLAYLQPFMEDPRYIRINGKPLFVVYRAHLIPNFKETVQMWRAQACEMGLDGLYVVSAQTSKSRPPAELGLDATMQFPPHAVDNTRVTEQVENLTPDFQGWIYDYDKAVSTEVRKGTPAHREFRTSMLSWDNTARRGMKAHVFTNFSLTRYSQWLAANVEKAAKDPDLSDDERIVFINAWNEWAEGTHLEPDQRYGYGYLEATRKVLANYDAPAAPFLSPDVRHATEARFAILAHVHYADTWPELKEKIEAMPPKSLDVYVTTTALETAMMIKASMPAAHVEIVDNRGRDVRPFLLMMQRIAHLNYCAICKVHGKKSVYREDGDTIRKSMLSALIDPAVLGLFDRDTKLGMLAAEQSIIRHDDRNMANNRADVKRLASQMGICFREGRFVAGTMFWISPKAIAALSKLDINDFDVERGLADGTRAHALERIFVNLVEHAGYSLKSI
ncbi:glycoside hydrolase family 99-like domain-containing protein [uncultured Shimia sp.]|uniref:glycoside hydrolase family 99-like domain-containing protein n=1 Tax=uncultured Shimia sp. TaxID=573152 RepID=UPI002621F461|nr:glycoside hydrolase family 99-like domain-containing protein [uncultured Shimia sp.]